MGIKKIKGTNQKRIRLGIVLFLKKLPNYMLVSIENKIKLHKKN